MRIRTGTKEFCYSAREFRKLSTSAICRRLSIGEDWIDDEHNREARRVQEQDEQDIRQAVAARTGARAVHKA